MAGRIYSEVRQGKPLSPEQEAYANLVRTASLLVQKETAALARFELSPAQHNILRILRGAGSEGLRCTDVAARMLTREPDVTRMLDRLERKELIRRAREQADRRVVTIRLGARGRRVLSRADKPVEQLQKRYLSRLGTRRLRRLIDLLEEIRKNMD